MTTSEAEELITILKKLLAKKFEIPNIGYDKEYEIQGIDNPRFKFFFIINRKVRISNKCTYIVRDKNTGINLLRLDIGNVEHKNPNGERIQGPHLNIFKDNYNTNNNIPYAIRFDINDPSLVANCVAFLKKFNVIEYPTIVEQAVLFN